MKRMKFEFSAGGIVYKNVDNTFFVLVAQHSEHHGWVFPKGLIGDHVDGEKKEDTAIREVEEETGVKARILKELTPVSYWYQWAGEKRKKTVYYYLMEFASEDPKKRDEEMETVEWLPLNKVENRLTYPSDKKVWKEAEKLIK